MSSSETALESSGAPEPDTLQRFEEAHSFWQNDFFDACDKGLLSKQDLAFVFEQYYLYSKNFTRYLSGLMANLEDDLLRSRLSENLWEEGGEKEPHQRHAQIFRNFLQDGLQIDIAKIKYLPATQHFVEQYLSNCIHQSALHSSAFLSLGTEGIVSRMYTILVKGMLSAGIEEKHLEFFRIHIGCDDEHAATLTDILNSYQHLPEWERLARKGLDLSLRLRRDFFNEMMREVRRRRVDGHLDRIQQKQSLLTKDVGSEQLSFAPAIKNDTSIYHNKIEAMNIDFTVDRAPFPAEVIDARVVRIPAGRNNERHKHAHETVFYIMEGHGQVIIDDRAIPVQKGDCVFVPRWAIHQSQNKSDGEMMILAVTDFHLTGKAFLGDYEATARKKRAPKQKSAPQQESAEETGHSAEETA